MQPSRLGHILDDTPPRDYAAAPGSFLKYKGRFYGWVELQPGGQMVLTGRMPAFLKRNPGMGPLSIRSSGIAFTREAKGPLLEKAERYDGEIRPF